MKQPAIALFTVLLTGGCVSTNANRTPLQDVYAARQLYTIALNTLTPLINAGVIDDPVTLSSLSAASAAAAAALDEAENHAAAGNTLQWQWAMNRLSLHLDKLLLEAAEAQRRKRDADQQSAIEPGDAPCLLKSWRSSRLSTALPS